MNKFIVILLLAFSSILMSCTENKYEKKLAGTNWNIISINGVKVDRGADKDTILPDLWFEMDKNVAYIKNAAIISYRLKGNKIICTDDTWFHGQAAFEILNLTDSNLTVIQNIMGHNFIYGNGDRVEYKRVEMQLF